MAQSIAAFEKTFVCGASSLETKQYYIVKQHTDGTAILSSGATDSHIGVLLNKPAVGAPALVRFAGTTKVKAGGAINPGAWVTSDGNGKAIATTSAGNVVIGQYLGAAAAADGDIIEIRMTLFVL